MSVNQTKQKQNKMKTDELDVAQIGKMFVTGVTFKYNAADTKYNSNIGKSEEVPAHWEISATLSETISRYNNTQSMSIKVEQGVGQKLAEILIPVVIMEASRKAQQLADDSKAMLTALGDRTIKCITDMPQTVSSKES